MWDPRGQWRIQNLHLCGEGNGQVKKSNKTKNILKIIFKEFARVIALRSAIAHGCSHRCLHSNHLRATKLRIIFCYMKSLPF